MCTEVCPRCFFGTSSTPMSCMYQSNFFNALQGVNLSLGAWARIAKSQSKCRLLDVSYNPSSEKSIKSLETMSKLSVVKFSLQITSDVEMVLNTLLSLPSLTTFSIQMQCHLGNKNWWIRKILPLKDLHHPWQEVGMHLPSKVFEKSWPKFRLMFLASRLPAELIARIFSFYKTYATMLSPMPQEKKWDYSWVEFFYGN